MACCPFIDCVSPIYLIYSRSKSGCAANYDEHAKYDDDISRRIIEAALKVTGEPYQANSIEKK